MDEVERGKALSNPEASKVYRLEVDRGPGGLFKKVEITAHGQFRMDLRGITVPEVRLALASFLKVFNDARSRQDYQAKLWEMELKRGEKIDWLDPKLGLFLAFVASGPGTVRIITAYWKGQKDPPPPKGHCKVLPRKAYQQPVSQLPGAQTWVKNPDGSGGKSDTGEGGGYARQGLPSPPWEGSKSQEGKPEFQTPPHSEEALDGRTIHQDKARTQGEPGSPHPDPDARTGPVRRPGMTGDDEEFWDDGDLACDVEGAMPPGRPYPSGQDRQRNQRSLAKRYHKKYYRRRRGRIRVKQKRRYRRYKTRSTFQNDQKRRDQRPEKFERRRNKGIRTPAERSQNWRDEENRKRKAFAIEPAPFIHMPSSLEGTFQGLDPLSGMVTYEMEGQQHSEPFDSFLDSVVFTTEEGLNHVLEVLDQAFDIEDAEGDEDIDIEDAAFDSWLSGSRVAYAVKYRPDKRQRRQKGLDKLKAKQRYKRTRARAKVKAKQRYKRLRKNPAFKKQQGIRRKHPERFKRRRAEVLTAPEIAFVLGSDMALGYVHTVSGMSGLVTYHRTVQGGNSSTMESMNVGDFMASVGFLSEQDLDSMFDLIEAEIGLEVYDELDMSAEGLLSSAALMGVDCSSPEFEGLCDQLVGKSQLSAMSPGELMDVDSQLVNDFTYDSGFMHQDGDEPDPADRYMIDPQDDDYLYGQVNLREDYIHLVEKVASRWVRRQAELLYEKRPPDGGDPDAWYDRGTDRIRKKRRRFPLEPMDQPSVDNNPGSSKVIPDGHGFENRKAALMREIEAGCEPGLFLRAKKLPVQLKRVNGRNAMWLFDVQGGSGTYRIRLQAQRKGRLRDLRKSHILVSCSCPFWRWQGPEHWAKKRGYLYGRPRGTASFPVIKDPSDEHGACKHVLAVIHHVTKHKWEVPEMPRGKKAALRFLADTLCQSELWMEPPQVQSLVERYLERRSK